MYMLYMYVSYVYIPYIYGEREKLIYFCEIKRVSFPPPSFEMLCLPSICEALVSITSTAKRN